MPMYGYLPLAGGALYGGVTWTANNFSSRTIAGVGVNIIDGYVANAGSNGPIVKMNKARGNVDAPTVALTNDHMANVAGYFFDGTAYVLASLERHVLIASTPSTTNRQSAITFLTTPAASTSQSETARFDHTNGFSMYGANVVIDANRHIVFRRYTVGTVPAASGNAGKGVMITPTSGNERLYTSNGSNWYDGAGTLLA